MLNHGQLKICKPHISQKGDSTTLTYKLLHNNTELSLWYTFPTKYSQYLSAEVVDAVVVSMLMYAMKNRLDIISDVAISANLYHSITKYLIPFLNRINPNLHLIKLLLPLYEGKFSGEHVGTGVSCGVDSLSTIIYHGLEEEVMSHKIDTLTLLNTGYYGDDDLQSSRYQKYLNQSLEFCKEHSFDFFNLDSNISLIAKYNFLSAHTYLTCSVILLFQKYFDIYYYSSGYPVYNFKTDFSDPAYYDVFLLDCISTQSLKFISSCSVINRVDKTNLICKYPSVLKHLYVCTSGDPSQNCCKCEKCVRTMLALESLGCTKDITFRYDYKAYQRNRIKYFSYMLRHRKNDVYYIEIYESFKKNHTHIPLLSRINIIPCRFEVIKMLGKFRMTQVGKVMEKIVRKCGIKR